MAAHGSRHKAVVRRAEAASPAASPPAVDGEEVLVFDPSVQLGAMAPLGYFDPLGFCKVGDEAGFRTLRAAELKHGRVAMMASIGAVGQHFIQFPWAEGSHGTFGALVTGNGPFSALLIVAMSAALEMAWQESPEKEPGNFGDPLGLNLNVYNTDMRSKELNNGRMAMISVLGIFAAEMATGKDAIQQFGLSALPAGAKSCSSASSFAGGSLAGSRGLRS